jgi:hypothetical protein
MSCPKEEQCKDIRDRVLLHRSLFHCFLRKGMSQQTKSDGSGEENSGEKPGLIGRFTDQYGKKQTSRAYRTDLQKFEAFLDENRGSATLEDASRRDVLRFLWAESQSVGRSTLRRRATALKSFFGWLEGKGHRDERPIEEDENVSSWVDAVLEGDPPAEENGGSAEQDRQPPSEKPTTERPTAEKKPTSDEEPTGEQPTDVEEPTAEGASPGGAENAAPETETDPDKKKSDSGSQAGQNDEHAGGEDTYTPTEGPLDIPHWIRDAAEGKAEEMVLASYGKHIPIAKVPGALRQGLDKLADWIGSRLPYYDYMHLVCRGGDLSVKIEYREDPFRIVAQIEHPVIERVSERGPDSLRSYHSVPEQALRYFRGRSWRMPPAVYELIDLSHTGGRPEKRPTWTSTSPGSTQARYQTAVEVTGALTKAFGLEKDEKVLVSLGP